MSKKIAIDVGGTTIKWALYDGFEKLESSSGKTNPQLSGEEMLSTVLFNPISEIVSKHKIDGIAVSTAGVVDINSGTVIKCGQTLSNYKNTNIKKLLEEKFKIEVSVENDSNCNALGELQNIDEKHKNILVLTLGTGVGGCLLLNRNVYRGQNFQAGEVGQMKLDNKLVDFIFSTNGLVNFVNSNGYNFENGLSLFESCETNEVVAQLVKTHINKFVEFIKNLDWILDFDLVVIGGGISKSKFFTDELKRQALEQQLNIVESKQGNDANFIGALIHFENMIK